MSGRDEQLDGAMEVIGENVSIAQRVAALRQEGELAWRRRSPDRIGSAAGDGDEPGRSTFRRSVAAFAERNGTPPDKRCHVAHGDERAAAKSHSASIDDRLSALTTSQTHWRHRTPQGDRHDAAELTVAARLQRAHGGDTPKSARCATATQLNGVTPTNVPNATAGTAHTPTTAVCTPRSAAAKCVERVALPPVDEGLDHFYKPTDHWAHAAATCDTAAFDAVASESTVRLRPLKSAVARRPCSRPASGNPLRSLAARPDLCDGYTVAASPAVRFRPSAPAAAVRPKTVATAPAQCTTPGNRGEHRHHALVDDLNRLLLARQQAL